MKRNFEASATLLAGKIAAAIFLLCLLAPIGGCRLCADCDDLDYPAYGGAWQRTRRDAGRVGSIFDPAGARASELVAREDPSRPDETARERQTQGDPPLLQADPPTDAERANQKEMDAQELEDRTKELRNRTLDDIETEREQEMRDRSLNDLNIQITTEQPAPPNIQ